MAGDARIGGWVAAACVVASLALAAGPAQAATINVNTTTDEFNTSGTGAGCSLREAIQAANKDAAFGGCSAGSGADTINLQAATAYPEQLGGCGAGGFNSDDSNVCGDFDISGDLTIQGAGAGTTTVDAQGFDRVFQIPVNVTVAINQVTIQGGHTNPQSGADFTGGGILNKGILTLNNDVITQNRTDSNIHGGAGGDGGGIWSSGVLTLNGTIVDHNDAGFAVTASNGGNGGGIANSGSGTLTVSGSTIANNLGGQGGNSGSPGNGGNGGGIYDASSGAVNISGTTVSGNTAGQAEGTGDGGYGGGIYDIGAGPVTISASTLDGNAAGSAGTGDGGQGGGLLVGGGTLVLTNSTVASNTAGSSAGLVGGSGGGIEVSGAPSASATLTDDTIALNAAGAGAITGGSGGGIEVRGSPSSSATLTNDTIALNAAGDGPGLAGDGKGGGVDRSAGTASLANTIVASSTLGGNCAGTITDGSHNVGWGDAVCPAGFATGNPNLGPLQNNGGPTQTMSVSGPVAVDQVPAAGANCPSTDQRGIARPQGPACDIGAFEVVNPITLSVSRSGTGTVTSSPAGIDCGATCSAQYVQHSSVSLTATPSPGSTFAGWSGACSGTGACTVSLDANTTVGASFAAKPPPGSPPNTKIKKAKISQAKNSAKFTFKSIGGSKAKATRGFQCALVKKRHRKPKSNDLRTPAASLHASFGAKAPHFRSCKSPKTYKHLKPRKYTFEVRAFDAAGKDATPAKKKFRIR